jgi:hypothetical protein
MGVNFVTYLGDSFVVLEMNGNDAGAEFRRISSTVCKPLLILLEVLFQEKSDARLCCRG